MFQGYQDPVSLGYLQRSLGIQNGEGGIGNLGKFSDPELVKQHLAIGEAKELEQKE